MAMDPTQSSTPEPITPDRSGPFRSRLIKIIIAVVGLVVLGYGAIIVYANFINDPEAALTTADLNQAVTVTSTTTDTSVTTVMAAPTTTLPVGLEGRWRATEDSELGYRVDEVLFGVVTQGVGRTNQITGELVIRETAITTASFEVEVASIRSDDSRRDGQLRGRIMNTAEFPTARFELTAPIELGSLPTAGEQITATAVGELTLRGETRPVTFEVTAQHSDTRIGVLGEISILFADYLIANPSISGISVEDEGLLEFVLVFAR
jgi:polyisoprenoid-binding protein YceI